MAGKLEFLSPEGLRIDGRRPLELRKLVARLGVFDQADGSAYVEMGNTKVLATVYGPHEAKLRSKSQHNRCIVNCEFSTATFATGERKRRPKGDRRSVEAAMVIRQTFEAAIMTNLYPRSQIDIYVQVLQADGGHVCAGINAANLALMDAGIPLHDYVTSCTAGCVDGTPILDLNYIEKSAGGPELAIACMPKSKAVLMCQMDQRVHIDKYESVLNLAIEGCEEIKHILDQFVRERTGQLLASFGPG